MLKENFSKTQLWGNPCDVQSLTFDLGNDHSGCSQDVGRVEGLVFADDGLEYADQFRQTLLHHLLEIVQVLCWEKKKKERWQFKLLSLRLRQPRQEESFTLKDAGENTDLLESRQIGRVRHANQWVTWTHGIHLPTARTDARRLINRGGTRCVLSACAAWKDKHSWRLVTVTQLKKLLFSSGPKETLHHTILIKIDVHTTTTNSSLAFMREINKTTFSVTSCSLTTSSYWSLASELKVTNKKLKSPNVTESSQTTPSPPPPIGGCWHHSTVGIRSRNQWTSK